MLVVAGAYTVVVPVVVLEKVTATAGLEEAPW
jgi:hypothetical protein